MLSMARVRVRGGAVFFLCVLLCLLSTSIGFGDDEEQRKKPASLWEWERLRSAYSIYSALFPATSSSIGHYCYMLKSLLNHAYARFFPPNIDFRRGGEAEAVTENGGAREKVNEALAKSFGKSKATVEDAAKSAANIAGETAHKVKRSFSEDREREHQNEL